MTKDYYLEIHLKLQNPIISEYSYYGEARKCILDVYEDMPIGTEFKIYKRHYVGDPALIYSEVRIKTDQEKEEQELRSQYERSLREAANTRKNKKEREKKIS